MPVFETALEKPSRFCFGMIDAIVHLKDKIDIPEGDVRSNDALYWYEISRQTGKNELAIFTEMSRSAMNDKEEAEALQGRYDFRDPAVMRLFASNVCRDSKLEAIGFFRDQKFLDALQMSENQAIIMEYIDIMAERNLFSFRDSEMPTLFLMLAQDREVLEGMRDRGVFQNYLNCRKKSDVIDRLADGEFTEKDRLSLFTESSYYLVSEKYYDERGEPRWKLFDDFCGDIYDGKFGKISFANVHPKIAPEFFWMKMRKRS